MPERRQRADLGLSQKSKFELGGTDRVGKPVEVTNSAVDGHDVEPPKWWRAGIGAWGCHQSHVAVMQRAIEDGVGSLLILEDDAVLVEGFAERVAAFLHIVPQDWDGLMLGGQHLEPPEIITPSRGMTPGLLRVRNGNRTHAYALRERATGCRTPVHRVRIGRLCQFH